MKAMTADDGPKMIPSQKAMAKMTEFYTGPAETTMRLDPLSIREYWFNEWRDRIKADYDVFVVVTGPVGAGKTTTALEAAMHLDNTFDASHIVYSPEELIDAVDRSQAGQVIVYDEAVLGVLATDTFKEEQKALIKTFATMRSKRLVLFLCIPQIFLLAKGVREERMTHWIAVVDRGIAWVHTKNTRVRYKMDPTLGVSVDRVHGPYTWKDISSTPLWKAYTDLKAKRVHAFLEETKARLLAAKSKGLRRPGRPRHVRPPEEGGADAE